MRRSKVGFWLYRTRRKDGTWHPRWRIRYTGPDGRPIHATGFSDKGETARLARQLTMEADEIRRGIRPAPTAADTESLRPIEEHRDAYLAWGKVQGGRNGFPWSEDHARSVKYDLKWWIDTLKLRTLRDINLPAVEKALQTRKVSSKTLFHIAGSLRSFVNWCRQRKLLANDPLDGLAKFSTAPVSIRRPLSLEEIGALLAAAPPERELLYRTAIVTGFRAGELESLKVGDLDVAKGILFLHAPHAKDRRDTVAPVPPDLAKDLEAAARGCPEESPLFPWFRADKAARMFHQDREAAGIKDATIRGRVDFHALRTTHVNLGIELGFDAKTAMALARHKTVEMTMNVYARANPDRLRGAVASLDRATSEATEKARNSRKEVESAVLPLAAGAENMTHPPDVSRGCVVGVKSGGGGNCTPVRGSFRKGRYARSLSFVSPGGLRQAGSPKAIPRNVSPSPSGGPGRRPACWF